VFLNLLATATSAVQTALLDLASWLARLDRIPQDHFKVFTQVLLALLESNILLASSVLHRDRILLMERCGRD